MLDIVLNSYRSLPRRAPNSDAMAGQRDPGNVDQKMVFQMRMIILIVAAALVSTPPCHAYLSLGPSEAPPPAIEQPNKEPGTPDAPKPAIERPSTGLAPLDAQKPAMGQPKSGSVARPRQDYTKRRSTPASPRNNAIGTGGRVPIQGIAD